MKSQELENIKYEFYDVDNTQLWKQICNALERAYQLGKDNYEQ